MRLVALMLAVSCTVRASTDAFCPLGYIAYEIDETHVPSNSSPDERYEVGTFDEDAGDAIRDAFEAWRSAGCNVRTSEADKRSASLRILDFDDPFLEGSAGILWHETYDVGISDLYDKGMGWRGHVFYYVRHELGHACGLPDVYDEPEDVAGDTVMGSANEITDSDVEKIDPRLRI
jgi:hypothetical protein